MPAPASNEPLPRSEDSPDPMTTVIVIVVGAVAVAGAYLRWATGPVLAAYRVGRQVERILAFQRARPMRPAPVSGAGDQDQQWAARGVD